MHLLGCNIVYWTNFNVFLFLQDRSDVLELKREKKKVYQTSGALKTVIFSIFGKIVKNDFSSFSPPPMKSTHELSSKSCFSSPWIYALQDKTKKNGGFRVKSWPNVASKQLHSRKKCNKNI